MTTTKLNIKHRWKLPQEEREKLRIELEQQVAAYIERGGEITHYPPCAFTEVEGYTKKLIGTQFVSLTTPGNGNLGAHHPKKERSIV
jgi:hypothetical protein